ncbi:DUF4350 domain-containing protein [Phytoactinopolyspora mesophila]|uniref:DUF4350 domain-containing protein n=1 Tax=Phytoactinopolyspora mesophila TaxID=2650750 RepID=A0A7K3M5H1_9ACTN|nr:DUF4350 domain-containing protein [Phytoactinopolyspora mesophila]NDL58569.1 DUF4350 domain-containing protein [Phytoactinopolyspora mesophila]
MSASATTAQAPPAASPAPAPPTPVGPDLRERLRRWRFPILMVAVLIVFSSVITILQGTGRGFLDPDGVNANGARALIRVLEQQGVEVTPVRTNNDAVAAAGTDSTILVTEPDRLHSEQFDELAASSLDLVLVAPTRLDEFTPGYTVSGESFDEVLAPNCDLPVAERAGTVRLGVRYYDGPAGTTTCYDGSLLIGSTAGDARLVLLGSHAPLINRYLDQDGNAALAMGLLGQNDHLIWYRPSYQPPPGTEQSVAELLPDWVVAVSWQLVIAVAFAAWWRSRRLGPVVAEPLPVVVRAAEATEGRARLYRRGRSRGHAAAILRDATIRRLQQRLGLPPGAPAHEVVAAVTAHSTWAPPDVADALIGSDPADDAALVRLADTLDALEQEVRSS